MVNKPAKVSCLPAENLQVLWRNFAQGFRLLLFGAAVYLGYALMEDVHDVTISLEVVAATQSDSPQFGPWHPTPGE